ncbi:hypothetical protein [Halosegnis sp.]|uniref:DUF7536 family protein n=1 Tax=Halosegnis sp. TaxID=2864959 RepID=UPI0035D5187D
MSEEPPDRPGVAGFLAALSVRRNAAVGFAVGLAVAIFLTYGAVTGPAGGYSDIAYFALGFVLAVGLGLLVAGLLTLGRAIRLARQ